MSDDMCILKKGNGKKVRQEEGSEEIP